MIVSALQSIWSFCEHRGEDDPADTWQGIEDRHVTMLLLLSRHVLSLVSANGFGELFAEPVELQFCMRQLAIDEPQLLDHHSDVSGRRLRCPLRHAQGRLAQLTDHMRRVETAYAITLENTSNGRLAHARGFVRRRCEFPQIEDPVIGEIVGDLQHLGVIAPKLLPQSVGQSQTLDLEVFADAQPFPELDNERLGDAEFAEQLHVGPEAVRKHIGIKAVILGPCDREAVAETVELFRVDGIDVEAALEQCFDNRTMRCLDGDMDLTIAAFFFVGLLSGREDNRTPRPVEISTERNLMAMQRVQPEV